MHLNSVSTVVFSVDNAVLLVNLIAQLTLFLTLFSIRPLLLCEDAKDAEPVSRVSRPKGFEWSCNTLWEERSWSTCDRRRSVLILWCHVTFVLIEKTINTQIWSSLCADGLVDPARPLSSFSPQPWHSCHKLIYVRPNPKTGVPVGHWPIPESFWPDQNSPTLVNSNLQNRVWVKSQAMIFCFYISGSRPVLL